MVKKRIIAAVLAACCALGAVSCTKKEKGGSEGGGSAQQNTASVNKEPTTAAENDINAYITVKDVSPAMWKVTDKETGNSLYMLGTMHMVAEDSFYLPDYVTEVYEKCDGVAVEYNMNDIMQDTSQMAGFYSRMMYTDGTTIKDHISEETYEKARNFMKRNFMYNDMMDTYTAGFWATEIEMASVMMLKNITQKGVDYTFMSMADNDGKKIINIETVEDQAAAMTAFTDELADFMMNELIDSADDTVEYTKSFAAQYDLWASGDIDALDEGESATGIPKELADDYAHYLDVVIYERNEGMADKAEEYLKEGKNYFFMVGAGHFAGNKGIDDILEARGYMVERVA
ncbi:TraB/GumN family protein [Ruminococcus flavefaciens]|uniref:TraB/GumN family protein n=1 Tax=Ruminococcus flavefaciens TaxID=1265 RepID=UPI00031F3639|nr:TraB/GumN family protein [Ruminococcus flavefaciens]